MDTVSYAYADEAHDRINELELIVTKSGDVVSLTGDVVGTTNVLSDGTIELTTEIQNDSHFHTVNTIIGLEDFVLSNSGLIVVTEGGNTGFRLYGKDIDNYGVIGEQAIDLSHSTDIYEQNGALGNYSIATGEGTVAKRDHSFVTGKYNVGKTDTLMEVGVGTSVSDRINVFEVYDDGRIHAPELTNDKIVHGSSLVTKEYLDLEVLQQLVGLTTIEKTQITNDEITLPKPALGDIVFNAAMVYDDLSVPWFIEVTCEVSVDKTKVLFDPADNLNNKYCVLTYLSYIN